MDRSILITSFTEYLIRNGKTKSTVLCYKTDIEQLRVINKTRSLETLESPDIQLSLAKWKSEGMSPKTISRKLNSIKTFYKFLENSKKIKENPTLEIHHNKFIAPKPRVLSQMEYLKLKDICRSNPKTYMTIELLLQTGIRISELCKIKIGDINLARKDPHIKITQNESNHERKVPLNNKIYDHLNLFISGQGNQKRNDYLFCTKDGDAIQVRNLRTRITKQFIKAKLKSVTVNDLRNTFIVYQLSKGLPIEKVAEIAGHKSIRNTERYLDLIGKKYRPRHGIEIFEL